MSTMRIDGSDPAVILKHHDELIKDLHAAVAQILQILQTNGLTTSGPISAASLHASGNVDADGDMAAGGNTAGNTLQSTGNGGQKFTLTIGSDASGPYINIGGPY